MPAPKITPSQALALPHVKHLCRLLARDSGNHPVYITDGSDAWPRQSGESYHAVSKTGIKAGMAALKRYWSTYSYVPSSLAVSVGAGWIASPRNHTVSRRTDDGVTMLSLPKRVIRTGGIRIIPGVITGSGRRVALVIRGKRTYHAAWPSAKEAPGGLRSVAADIAAVAVAEWARQDSADRLRKAMDRDLTTTRVTIHDARRAGNCMIGILGFAERKLHVSRETALQSHFSVPALLLRRLANGDGPAVDRAIAAAYARETTVCI